MALQAINIQESPQTIIVASQNPVKINASLEGFIRMFPTSIFAARGVTVASGVPDQPFSDDETLRGALNRAQNARTHEPNADYWVGLEGGLDTHAGTLQSFAWIVVLDKGGRTGKARTATYFLPEEVAKLVREGMELGDADDIVFGRSNSKQETGSSGLLTDNAVDRSMLYMQAVILALIPFKNANLTF